MILNYDVVVIGGGHAGCEAAAAAARIGAKTCLVTMDMNKIAQMSCNPAVGGIAKGQIVREIDALGGYMGIVTDQSSIQFRLLNRSKGPAMWSPRAQCDRGKFIWNWRTILDEIPNLHIWQDSVEELLVEKGVTRGVRTAWGITIQARCVILTAGTFLNGLMHIGKKQVEGGRCAEPPSLKLTESITRHGIRHDRMKTGTPVRIDGRSVHFEDMERQDGESDFHRFSYLPMSADASPRLTQRPCWMTTTNDSVHEALRGGLEESPLYNGQIQSIGPRYCPSIETKIITFADKDKHQLFLEPEGETTQEYYLNGFSSSLPVDVQINALRHVPAFRDIVVYRPGYAIEYDFFDPTQLTHSLESKLVDGLFFAGQVNGTTGYEEAGGQGLMAGINAAHKCAGSAPFILGRDEAYIGVLIDDLITKGVDEPYRMFTSRAEYRILLRQDDADARLTPKAEKLGLASGERLLRLQEKQNGMRRLSQFLQEKSIKPIEINHVLTALETAPIQHACRLIELVGRPQIGIESLRLHVPELAELASTFGDMQEEITEATEIQIKYSGYINRERQIAEKMQRLEHIKIRGKFDYASINALSIEARQKLERVNPETLAQASRIPGISPSDINALLVLAQR